MAKPTRERQGNRLGSIFDDLAQAADDPAQILQLQQDPQAIAPERAIVFEVAGSLTQFYQEAHRIGLEYLGDDEFDIEPDDDFRRSDRPDSPIAGRVYLAMPNLEALKQLVRLWRRYQSDDQMFPGLGMWTQLFGLLKNVRAWGPEDRLTVELISRWQEQLDEAPEEHIRFEVELWFRENDETRQTAFTNFSNALQDLAGSIIDSAIIPEIRYHAALIDLPTEYIRQLIADPTVALARVDEIMFIRPQSMATFPVDGERENDPVPAEQNLAQDLPPIAALLDGLPIQNHHRLANRLVVDDPEGLEPGYQVAARKHGTEMASLIIHGDINRGEAPLGRRLHVRPILQPVQTLNGWDERTPTGKLLVDHVFRAVRRLKEGEAEQPPIAPNVFLINLSLGDESRQFSGPMSPWARLLDHLAYCYNVLFLVSAGNALEKLAVAGFPNWAAFENAASGERDSALFAAIDAKKAFRTILSPAEAMNILTVGAAHRDAVPQGGHAAAAIDAISRPDLPNLSSRLGLGFRRVVKPDLIVDGGREYVDCDFTEPNLHVAPALQAGRAFGLRAAAPDATGGDRSKTALTWGTSAATALTTRAGHLVFDALMDNADNAMLANTPSEYHPLIVKALLVHGSAWGEGATVLESLSNGNHYAKKDNISRYIGYGVLDVSRIVACTAERATLIGYGELEPGSASVCRIPLPQDLEGEREPRSVTVTLAWFSPINPLHQGYRRVAMDAKPGEDSKYSLGVTRTKAQPHDKAISRGTIFHDRRVGERAVPYVDDGNMIVKISARRTAGEFNDAVPFALAISIEVGAGSHIPVYDQIRNGVLARIGPPVTT